MKKNFFYIIICLYIFCLTGSAASAVLSGCPIFPDDNIWNTPIANLPADVGSDAYVSSIGAATGLHPDFGSGTWEGAPIGIPYVEVDGSQPKVPVAFNYTDESDPGPYPIPPDALIEGGPDSDGDRHILIIDKGNCLLYELYHCFPQPDGSWTAGSGAIFDLNSNTLRPDSWTSADAAGLPILPGLVRYDEVASGEINHALRFTAPQTRRNYVWPARHYASSLTDPEYPPMGQRFRLKADFDISGFSPDVQVILTALKKYGMILADNGSSWFISGAPDERWDNDILRELKQITGSDFEAVDVSSLMVSPDSGQVDEGAICNDCSSGTTYFVSASQGDDGHDGLSPDSAWQTLESVNSRMFEPGDTIRFRRGDTWRTHLFVRSKGTEDAYISYGAYGTGSKPRFLGSEEATGWTEVSTNIWQSGTPLNNPYQGGYSYSEVFFEEQDSTYSWGRQRDYDAVFSQMSAERDWAWNNDTIYVYALSNPEISYRSVEVPQRDNCLVILGVGSWDRYRSALVTADDYAQYIAFDNLEVMYAMRQGIYAGYQEIEAHGFRVTNCHIGCIGVKGGASAYGIAAWYSDALIQNNVIHDCGRRSVSYNTYTRNTPNLVVSNVTIDNNYFYNGYHTTGPDISSLPDHGHTFTNFVISNNVLDDTGIQHIEETSNSIYVEANSGNFYSDFYIYNNTVIGSTARAILLNRIDGVYVYHNTIYGNHPEADPYSLVTFGDVANIDFRNNIIHSTLINPPHASRCVLDEDATTFTIRDNNLYYQDNPSQPFTGSQYGVGGWDTFMNEWEWWTTESGFDLNSPEPQLPLFVNPEQGNLNLQSTSPAVDSGVIIPGFNDYYQGNAPDLGAIESPYTIGDVDDESPSIPTALTVTGADASHISISWNDSTDNIGVAGYTVYRNGAEVATVATTVFGDSGLSADTSYTYTVSAYDAGGNVSSLSDALIASTTDGITLPDVSITASSYENEGATINPPAHVSDGDLSTRWSAYGVGEWIEFSFAEEKVFDTVSIAFHRGNDRSAYFAVEISNSGTNWTEVFSGQSSGATLALENFTFPQQTASYFRIVGGGNSENVWNSYTEVEWSYVGNGGESTTYYVSNEGSDSHDGLTSATAWQTIAKVNAETLVPGDKVLFCRGDTWREALVADESGTGNAYITFGAYGTGAKPRILGSIAVDGWTETSIPNVWQSAIDLDNPWTVYTASGTNCQIFFVENSGDIIWGYFEEFDNSFTNLTNTYDWTWNDNKLYVFSPSNPNSHYSHVEAPQRQYSAMINHVEHVAFDNLEMAYCGGFGIRDAYPPQTLSGLKVTNSYIHHIGRKGSNVAYGTYNYHSDAYYAHNEIHDCGRRGISVAAVAWNTDVIVDGIMIENNYFHHGFHTTGIDINLSGEGAHVIRNVVIRNNFFEGHPDVFLRGGDRRDLYFDDGLNTNHIFIANQNIDSTGSMSNVDIYNNVFTYSSGKAIALENTQNARIYYNTFYAVNPTLANTQGQVYIAEGAGRPANIDIRNNVFYNDMDHSFNSGFMSVKADINWIEEVFADNNLYFTTDPSNTLVWIRSRSIDGVWMEGDSYRTADWTRYQDECGWDQNSPVPGDPMFIDPENDNFTLQAGSPAIGAGMPIPLVMTDILGNPRDLDHPTLGAYEYMMSECTLTASSTEGGNVTVPGEGIFNYECGTIVTLSAEPIGGYAFDSWTGDVSISDLATTTIIIDTTKTVSANFTPAIEFCDLITSSTAGGSVTAPGEGTFTYECGTVVELAATPLEGYAFVNWSGDVADPGSALTTITMAANKSVSANFAEIIINFNLIVSSSDGGSVSSPGEGTFTYTQGSDVELVASAFEGYEFVNWTGDVDNPGSASTTITMTANMSITANFTAIEIPTVAAHYKFNNDYTDTSGNENHGVNNGTIFSNGKIDQAAKFDGINDYVSADNADSLDITGEITLSVWIYYTPQNDRYASVISKMNTGTNWKYACFAMGVRSSRVRYGTDGGGKLSTQILEPGNWYHLVMTHTDGYSSLYINGNLDSFATDSFARSSEQPLIIGARKYGTKRVGEYTGLIDDVRIYNLAISDDAIMDLFELAPISPVTDLVAAVGDGQVALNWQNPRDLDFAGVLITRTSCPAEGASYVPGGSISQNIVVYKGAENIFVDTKVMNRDVYHYNVFAFSNDETYSSVVSVYAKPEN